MYDTFREELGNIRDPVSLLQFMKTAPADLLVQKTPAVDTSYLLVRPYWSTVIEGEWTFLSFLFQNSEAKSILFAKQMCGKLQDHS